MNGYFKNNHYILPKKVGIVHSFVKRSFFPTEELYITEKDSKKDANLISLYLQNMGVKTCVLPANSTLPERIKKERPDMILNLADSVRGQESLASTIPGILEVLEIPYTGSDMLGLALDTNKFLIKKLYQQNGIPTPHYQLVSNYTDLLDPTLRYPLISKLNEVHGAVEIDKNAISENERHLRERIKYLISTYKQSVLIEEFIVGRELTAILLEGLNKKVYLAEKVFDKKEEKYTFATFADQWVNSSKDAFHYQKYEDPILTEYVRRAFDTSKMCDYAKFDIRMDSSGRYYFIDSNSNPAFGPKELDCALANILDLYNIPFKEILKRLLLNTIRDSQGKERLPLS